LRSGTHTRGPALDFQATSRPRRQPGRGRPALPFGRVPVRLRLVLPALLVALPALLAACGSYDRSPPKQTLACIRADGVSARETRPGRIEVEPAGRGPTVVFHQSRLEAESKVLSGEAAGAESIARALLYVNDGTDPVLKTVETCLEDVLE
jgi:hypothetical protein